MSSELVVPVYLNQRIVFDLLAMLQGGISTVTQVSSTSLAQVTDQRRYGTAFGLSEALAALLKVSLSGDRAQASEEQNHLAHAEERIHTPASLFFKLREMLAERGHLKSFEDEVHSRPGDIIAFPTVLTQNPLIRGLDTFVGMMEMASIFDDSQPKHGKGKKQQPTEAQMIIKKVAQFSAALKAGTTIDMVGTVGRSEYRAVVSLEQEFLSDPTMADLVDGQFTVMGKVVRTIDDSSESISLLRKSAISAMPSSALEEAVSHIDNFFQDSAIQVPPMNWDIQGPVIQVLPIAVYA